MNTDSSIEINSSTPPWMTEWNICDFTPELVDNEEEFVELAEIILKRLQRLKRELYPSWFQRTFRSKKTTPNKPTSTDYGILTSRQLNCFKLALLIRLEDNSFSVFIDYPSLTLMNSIIRHVEKVGWPETDDNITNTNTLIESLPCT